MPEAPHKTADAEDGGQTVAHHPRALWQRPTLRRLQADHAELSVTNSAPDGTFTTS
jgi:hypothetical protein